MEGCHADAMRALGEGMHTGQDQWAHYEQNAYWGTGCDAPKAHPREYRSAETMTRVYVQAFVAEVARRMAGQ